MFWFRNIFSCNVCIAYTHTHTHTYIYIYIYLSKSFDSIFVVDIILTNDTSNIQSAVSMRCSSSCGDDHFVIQLSIIIQGMLQKQCLLSISTETTSETGTTKTLFDRVGFQLQNTVFIPHKSLLTKLNVFSGTEHDSQSVRQKVCLKVMFSILFCHRKTVKAGVGGMAVEVYISANHTFFD